ncbi:hypothetical protein [Nitratireductor indicus]|uniref:hypothetical protein n=1 Tax=Nitratireductor indicus TaxID=721133 RepID=UPI002875EEB6|nr:hypothetical protein [Nitratireductor indicus]MDS1138581.1 hypothetical protein [Nitratireductor indicus]
MATDVQISNLALTRIGHESITSFNASGNKAERWLAANYEFIKQSLLREHQWRFATKRAVLTRTTIYTITGATAANPVVVTIGAGHSISNGAEVYIAGVVGMTDLNNKTFTTANVTGTTLELSGVDGTSYSAYSSAGSLTEYVATEYAYRFSIPSDCLRVLRINGDERDDYRIEGGYLYSNEGEVNIEYIFDVTDESAFDALFVDLLASRLSAEICFYMTDNSTLTEQSWNIYKQKLSISRTMDSRQGMPRGIEADAWLSARI